MNWSRAKTLTIVFLVVLNAFLGIMLAFEQSKYVLGSARQTAIINLMEKNGIRIETPIPKFFKPRRQLTIAQNIYDEHWITETFFPDTTTDIKAQTDGERHIYSTDDAVLVLMNGYLSYDRPKGTGVYEQMDVKTALSLCGEVVKRSGLTDFYTDVISESEEGIRVVYCERFKGMTILTNFMDFYVTKNGIMQIDCVYGAPQGFTGTSIEVCAADEAMYSFMREARNAFGNRELFVDKMDMVYFQDDRTADAAVPYYRIYVRGIELPFLINAYTNKLVS